MDSDDPDLRPLRDNGAKLIVYHGWSDPDISSAASLNYYDSVVDVIASDIPDAGREFLLPPAGLTAMSRQKEIDELRKREAIAREMGGGKRRIPGRRRAWR